MPIAKTKYGFTVEVDEDVKVGDKILLPPPQVEEPTKIPDRILGFTAQMFGSQKEWNQTHMGKYAIPDGLKYLPDFIMNLNGEQLKRFMIKMYSAGATLVKHYSGTNDEHYPEVWFRVKSKEVALQVQQLWLRLGVRVRVYVHPRWKDQWMVQNASMADYVALRPYLVATYNPKLTQRLRKMDVLIGFNVRVNEYKAEDKVVEILEDGAI